MADKLVVDCSTGELAEQSFTPEELAQREYEASLPPVIPEPTEVETLQEKVVDIEATQAGIIDTLAIITGVAL